MVAGTLFVLSQVFVNNKEQKKKKYKPLDDAKKKRNVIAELFGRCSFPTFEIIQKIKLMYENKSIGMEN